MSRWWPLHDLRIRTGTLELRLPSYDDLVALGELAHDGIHDPAVMPFGVPWTDVAPDERARSTMQWHWQTIGAISADSWQLPFAVVDDGVVVGMQEVGAKQFRVCREVSTGSWLGRRHQGRGIGTRMRAAVLHLAFAELHAEAATTSAYDDNPASNGVTRRLGYEPNGVDVTERRGKAATMLRYRMTRARWEQRERPEVDVAGVAACRPLLGADWEL
jgi:RimJ/RimL family protein N-acetyltransferase